jgi:ribosomal protein L29
MLFSELKNKSASELYEMIAVLKKERLDLFILRSVGTQIKSGRIKEARRDVARIMTRLRQIKLGK